MGTLCWVEQQRHSRNARRDSPEHFQPFAAHRGLVKREPGNIAARTSEVRDEATGNWIGYGRDHDRNCLRLTNKSAGHGRSHTENCVWPQIDQLFCECLYPIRISTAPAQFDSEIAAFRPPQLRQPTPERCEPRL